MLNQWTRNVKQNRPCLRPQHTKWYFHWISRLDTERRFGRPGFSQIERRKARLPSSSANICAVNTGSCLGVRRDLWPKLFVCQRFITTKVKHEIAGKHAKQIVEKKSAKRHEANKLFLNWARIETRQVERKQIPSHVFKGKIWPQIKLKNLSLYLHLIV